MIRVVIQDENGQEFSPAIDVPSRALPQPRDIRFTCLRFVDPYGDTLFNQMQLTPLLEDVRLLRRLPEGTEHDIQLRQLESLIVRCQEGTHLYLKFVGD